MLRIFTGATSRLALGAFALGSLAQAQTIDIFTVADLQGIAADLDGDYVLQANLDLIGVNWVPIGTVADPFTGSLNGNGRSISGLELTNFSADPSGLFGHCENAEFRGVRMLEADVFGIDRVGTLAGNVVDSDIISCSSSGHSVTGLMSVGGLVGRTAGCQIERCGASGDVLGFQRWAGGLVGHMHIGSFMERCRTRGTVTGTDSVGGLTGNVHNSVVMQCDSSADVVGGALVGGLTGWMQEDLGNPLTGASLLMDCSASGSVLGTDGGIFQMTDMMGNNIFLVGTTGGLVGWADAKSVLLNCHAYGDVDAPNNGFSAPPCGGLIGRIEHQGIVTGCSASGDVLHGSTCGGLIAWVMDDCDVTDCIARGDVDGLWQTGGLVGALERGHLEDCHATGNVRVPGTPNGHGDPGRLVAAAGGLVGYTFPSNEVEFGTTIYRCSAKGSVGTGGQFTGGLIGLAWGVQVIDSFATGAVKSPERRIGGLVGGSLRSVGDLGMIPRSEYLHCYALGRVTQSQADPGYDGMVGGLIGEIQTSADCDTHLHRSYSAGEVIGTGTVGGLVGEAGAELLYHPCYWDIETSGLSTSAVGTGATTAQMQAESTFIGWTFPFPWLIDEGNGYPYLHWQ